MISLSLSIDEWGNGISHGKCLRSRGSCVLFSYLHAKGAELCRCLAIWCCTISAWSVVFKQGLSTSPNYTKSCLNPHLRTAMFLLVSYCQSKKRSNLIEGIVARCMRVLALCTGLYD